MGRRFAISNSSLCGTMEPRSPGIKKLLETLAYRNIKKQKENVLHLLTQASMRFMLLLSPISITTNFLRSYEVVGACQAELAPLLLVASCNDMYTPLPFLPRNGTSTLHILKPKKLKQSLGSLVASKSCCILYGLSSRKRNPIKLH